MHLARGSVVVANIRDDFSFSTASIIEIFSSVNSNWVDSAGELVSKPILTSTLAAVDTSPYCCDLDAKVYYVSIPSLQAVARIEFTRSPSDEELARLDNHLQTIAEKAQYKFDAEHDDLTGFSNRREFERLILKELAPQATLPEDHAELAVTSNRRVYVLAADLDHFKQVNDAHGHLYGDIVLQSFALRLRESVDQFRLSELGSKTTIALARPSGEEFNILVAGPLDDSEVFAFAEAIRNDVARDTLPNERDWEIFKSSVQSEHIAFPHASERKITVSIGISSPISSEAGASRATTATLLGQADVAMYRSKAGNRNRVTLFGEILSRHGSVIEHHEETNVVAIDIGENVNVRFGQEFTVFHPDFSGEKDFIYTDGRTRKVLGTYPKRQYGRIVVFSPQKDMSFCRVLESETNRFAVNSRLEAVALGSIAAYIGQAEGAGNIFALPTADDINANVSRWSEFGTSVCCAVFTLAGVPQLTDERGSQFVNESLGKLYAAIRAKASAVAVIAQVNVVELAVAWPTEALDTVREFSESVLRQASESVGGLAAFQCGLYFTGSYGDASTEQIEDVHALEYAGYALSAIAFTGAPVQIFNQEATRAVLYDARQKKQVERGLADYRRLRELGVRDAQVENHGALLAYDAGEFKLAVDAIDRAASMKPTVPTYWLNRAFIQTWLKEYANAFQSFVRAADAAGSPLRQLLAKGRANYVTMVIVAYFAQYTVTHEKDLLNELRYWLGRAKAELSPSEETAFGEMIAAAKRLVNETE